MFAKSTTLNVCRSIRPFNSLARDWEKSLSLFGFMTVVLYSSWLSYYLISENKCRDESSIAMSKFSSPCTFSNSFEDMSCEFWTSSSCGLITSFTTFERNIFLPIGIWTTTVSPSICINFYGPSHRLELFRYIYTAEPDGSLLSPSLCSTPRGPLSLLSPNATLRFDCSRCTMSIALSIA